MTSGSLAVSDVDERVAHTIIDHVWKILELDETLRAVSYNSPSQYLNVTKATELSV